MYDNSHVASYATKIVQNPITLQAREKIDICQGSVGDLYPTLELNFSHHSRLVITNLLLCNVGFS